MPTINLVFPQQEVNISAQIGDTTYYVPTSTDSEFTINSSSIVKIGVITDISSSPNGVTIQCNTSLPNNLWPDNTDFILFSKDSKANMSSLLGYYAEVTVRNNSQGKAEMFQISADYFQSSK